MTVPGWLGKVLILALVAGAGRIIAPLTVQRVIDSGLAAHTVGPAIAIGSVAVLVAGASSMLLNRSLQERVESTIAGMRRAGLRRVHDMAASRVDRIPAADLVSRLTADLDQMTTFLQGGGIQFVTNTAQLLIAGVIMSVYSWQLALPVLLIAAVLLAGMYGMQRVIGRRFVRARNDLSGLQRVVTESVAGAAVIRSTGTDDRMRAKLDTAVDRARDSLIRTLPPLHANASFGEIAIATMTLTVLLGGVGWALAGDGAPRLTAGQVVAMVFLVTFFVRPLQFLVQSLGEAQNALAGWRRAKRLVETPSAVVTDGVALPPGPVAVRVERATARYGDGPPVLHEVTVGIEAGEHVAIVGRTGSGKSTFAKLLTRRLEPASGTVLLSGVPLDRLAPTAGRVVILPQDPFLFEGTVSENVHRGDLTKTGDDVLRVFDDLGLGDWLNALPDGPGTEVGLRGERLSAGERQLVGLARTALADPDLVIFDEATSGIDPATDVAVQSALATLTRGRTTIAIAHRMVTAENADRVLVFDAGRIVQSGPHHVLAGQQGPYRKLVEAWNRA